MKTEQLVTDSENSTPPKAPPEPGPADTVTMARVGAGDVVLPEDLAQTTPPPPPPSPAALEAAYGEGGHPDLDGPPPGYGDPAVLTASPGMISGWLAEAARVAGQPASITVSGYTREALVNVPDADTFKLWCAYLRLEHAQRRAVDRLGEVAEAVADAHGWTIKLSLFGAAAVEALR